MVCLNKEYLRKTRKVIEEFNRTREMDTTIWKSLRKLVFRPCVQQFLYKTMHKAYKIGNKWNNVPGYRERAICSECERMESMQHILLKCNRTACQLIWEKMKEIWPHRQQIWPNILIGTILGVGCNSTRENRRMNDSPNTLSMENNGQTRLVTGLG